MALVAAVLLVVACAAVADVVVVEEQANVDMGVWEVCLLSESGNDANSFGEQNI